MSRYTGPVTRLSRRLGVALFTNGESKNKAFQKKNFKPGQHGQKRFSQMSEFSRQLLEKQKARFMYNITEKQSRKYYEMASKTNEVTGIKYLSLLEQRLDNVMYRSGIAQTRPQGRQIVSHGLVMLNGKRVNTPSILVKIGDKFEVMAKKKDSKLFEETKKEKTKAPKWMKVELPLLKGEVTAVPGKDDIENIIEHQLITEYYSK
ncbi:30S ribosomal protein S4 [Candidatus Peregrinibacteria bacterium]|nr:30S ribosomal protein S4 [Candidatus Peregrinibacteria bacterium]